MKKVGYKYSEVPFISISFAHSPIETLYAQHVLGTGATEIQGVRRLGLLGRECHGMSWVLSALAEAPGRRA